MSFSLDLSRAIQKAKGRQELIVKKVMLEAFAKVVMKSPVDTGRFRANWQAWQGNYSRASLQLADKAGTSTVGKITAKVGAMNLDGQTIYLTNALPYAVRLEHGWSQQAPSGMVKLTLAEISAHYGT